VCKRETIGSPRKKGGGKNISMLGVDNAGEGGKAFVGSVDNP